MCEAENCDFYHSCSIKEQVRDPKCNYYQEKYTLKNITEKQHKALYKPMNLGIRRNDQGVFE